jgi:starvation-inducible DNA-binding protein
MFRTKIDISEEVRNTLVPILSNLLADGIDLRTQIKQAHWNVRGPNFIALHELFDHISDEVDGHVDLIAERSVQLGGVAEGTARTVARRSSLPEYPTNAVSGRDHVEALATALANFGAAARKAIRQADGAGDPVSSDVLTEISRGIDRRLWMVEAHLHQ